MVYRPRHDFPQKHERSVVVFAKALKIHVRALRTPLLLLSPAEYNALGLGADRPLPVDDRAGEAADALLCRHVPLQRREAFQVRAPAAS